MPGRVGICVGRFSVSVAHDHLLYTIDEATMNRDEYIRQIFDKILAEMQTMLDDDKATASERDELSADVDRSRCEANGLTWRFDQGHGSRGVPRHRS